MAPTTLIDDNVANLAGITDANITYGDISFTLIAKLYSEAMTEYKNILPDGIIPKQEKIFYLKLMEQALAGELE